MIGHNAPIQPATPAGRWSAPRGRSSAWTPQLPPLPPPVRRRSPPRPRRRPGVRHPDYEGILDRGPDRGGHAVVHRAHRRDRVPRRGDLPVGPRRCRRELPRLRRQRWRLPRQHSRLRRERRQHPRLRWQLPRLRRQLPRSAASPASVAASPASVGTSAATSAPLAALHQRQRRRHLGGRARLGRRRGGPDRGGPDHLGRRPHRHVVYGVQSVLGTPAPATISISWTEQSGQSHTARDLSAGPALQEPPAGHQAGAAAPFIRARAGLCGITSLVTPHRFPAGPPVPGGMPASRAGPSAVEFTQASPSSSRIHEPPTGAS